jgi:hypothetical protein
VRVREGGSECESMREREDICLPGMLPRSLLFFCLCRSAFLLSSCCAAAMCDVALLVELCSLIQSRTCTFPSLSFLGSQ